MFKELAHSPLLRAHAPYTISGYRMFREIIDTDGAISSQIKALLVTCVDMIMNSACKAHNER